MADDARLHALLDLVEQARNEGDKETEAKATAAYKREAAPVSPYDTRSAAAAKRAGVGAPGARETEVMDFVGAADMLASGAVGSVGLGAAGLAAMPVATLKALGAPVMEPADVVRGVSGALSYKPFTKRGQEMAEGFGENIEKMRETSRTLGERAAPGPLDETSKLQAALGTIGENTPEVLATLAGAKLPARGAAGIKVLPRAAEGGLEYVITSPNGKSVVRRRGDALQEIETATAKEARGKGEGAARVEEAVKLAQADGRAFISDTSVSPNAVKMYERLEAKGYTVKRNAETSVDANGQIVSDNGRPVFEVSGKAKVTPADIVVSEGKGGPVRTFLDAFSKKGRDRIIARHVREDVVGTPEAQAAVINKLEAPQNLPPGVKPTVGDIMSQEPQGGGLLAEEKMVRRVAGEPNEAFALRTQANRRAVAAAADERAAVTDPMREAALERANTLGAADAILETGIPGLQGIKTGAVKRGINAYLSKPGVRASDVARKTLADLQEKLATLTDEHGLINVEDLKTVRNELSNTIKTFAKEKGNWDKRFTAGLTREIQRAMDDAIEAGGGKGWKDYLAKYGEMSEQIGVRKRQLEGRTKPLEAANMTGAKLGASPQLPNAFSREILITNAILRAVTPDMSRAFASRLARLYLNPAEMAAVLRGEKMPESTITKLRQGAVEMGVGTRGAAPAVMTAEEQRRQQQAAALRQE